jgi:hypothetical protein
MGSVLGGSGSKMKNRSNKSNGRSIFTAKPPLDANPRAFAGRFV